MTAPQKTIKKVSKSKHTMYNGHGPLESSLEGLQSQSIRFLNEALWTTFSPPTFLIIVTRLFAVNKQDIYRWKPYEKTFSTVCSTFFSANSLVTMIRNVSGEKVVHRFYFKKTADLEDFRTYQVKYKLKISPILWIG